MESWIKSFEDLQSGAHYSLGFAESSDWCFRLALFCFAAYGVTQFESCEAFQLVSESKI